MKTSRIALAAALALFGAVVSAPATAQEPDFDAPIKVVDGRRVALVIGNSGYTGSGWTKLPNAARDAAQMQRSLQDAKFDKVIAVSNGSKEEIEKAASEFAREASKADIALVYYSGHGFEHEGSNFIVPVGATGFVEADKIAESYVPMRDIVDSARAARAFSMFFLDACRLEGPVKAGSKAPISEFRWIDAPHSAIIYATAGGAKAYDEAPAGSPLSPFAAAVTRGITTPGVELSTLFKRAVDYVSSVTRDKDPRQWPQTHVSTPYSFYFIPPMTAAAAESVKPKAPVAQRLNIPLKTLATVDEPVIAARLLEEHKVTEIIAMADAGDPLAQYLVGYFYAYGHGLQQNKVEALKWLEKAAATGHPAGQLELAYFLSRNASDGAAKTRALDLYQKASAQGYAKAQSHLAAELMQGTFGTPDWAEAKRLIRLAAASDYPWALRSMIGFGEREPNLGKLKTLSAGGDATASHWLCDVYVTDRNFDAAAAQCETAAQAGFSDSRARLAILFAEGKGVTQSAEQARYWAKLALGQSDLNAIHRGQLNAIAR